MAEADAQERAARAKLYRPSGEVTPAAVEGFRNGDESRMRLAVLLARSPAAKAARQPPFGCVIAGPAGETLAVRHGTGGRLDPTSHSEILAIRDACAAVGGLLDGCVLYSTLEPCPMCCGAINHAKIGRVVFGAYRTDLPRLFRRKTPCEALLKETSHPPVVRGGVLRDECTKLFEGVEKWD